MAVHSQAISRNDQRSAGYSREERRHLTRLLLGFAAFLAFIIILLAINTAGTRRKIDAIEQDKSRTQVLLNQEYEKQLDIKAQSQFYLSDVYYGRMARKRFNLIMSGDHVYVFD